MVKEGQLTAKQEAFIEFYTTLGAETYNNAMQAALKAGYANDTANQACRLILGSTRVKVGIEQARAANRSNSLSNVQDIRDMHKQLMDEAVKSGDKALARLNLQDLGRTYAAYTDKAIVDSDITINIQRFGTAPAPDQPYTEPDSPVSGIEG